MFGTHRAMQTACVCSTRTRYLKLIRPRDEHRRRSSENLSGDLYGDSLSLVQSCSSSSHCRRTSVSLPIRRRFSGVSKKQEPLGDRPFCSRPAFRNEGQVIGPDLSWSVPSINKTPDSSCEQVSSIASRRPSASHANAGTEGQSHVGGNERLGTTLALRLRHQTEIKVEAEPSRSLDNEYISSLPLPLEPDTEYQANLDATSDETRPLFIEYYERTHGAEYVEDEDIADTYWKWDPEKQLLFHTNEDTGSVAWFTPDLAQPCHS